MLFRFSSSHNRKAVEDLLGSYSGYVVADAHAVYNHLFDSGDAVEVGCWSHCRRYFFNSPGSDPPRAKKALAWIGALFRVDRSVAEAPRNKRESIRKSKSRPIAEQLFAWCNAEQDLVLDESPISKAISYAINQRNALCQFLDDGRLPLTSCQMHGLEPWAYLRDLLCLLPQWKSSRVLELAPAYFQHTAEQSETRLLLERNPFRRVLV